MANVTYHRTDRKQVVIKEWLISTGVCTEDEISAGKRVRLGDDSTVEVRTAVNPDDYSCALSGVIHEGAPIRTDVYAIFGGRVKLVDSYLLVIRKITI